MWTASKDHNLYTAATPILALGPTLTSANNLTGVLSTAATASTAAVITIRSVHDQVGRSEQLQGALQYGMVCAG